MRLGVLLCCAVVLFTGCASSAPSRTLRYSPWESARERGPVRAVANSGVQVDAWEQLLTNAGLEARDERPVGEVLTPTQAARLLGVLLRKPVTRDTLPPRMVVGFVLREVLERSATSREELLRRVERFARERIAVPVGRTAAVLSGGPGAAIVLQRANSGPAPSQGPGQWGPVKESISTRARRYQEQITGHTADEAYWVGGANSKAGGVKFDGFKDGVLLEAKGPGYAEFFESNLDPKNWFEASGKLQDLVDQAERQRRIVQGMGIRIEWHVAEKHAADAMRRMLENRGFTEIAVIHTPARTLVR